jgi:hypothetical protein
VSHEYLPSFITFKYPTYTINPKTKNDLGTFKIKAKLSNNLISKIFEFTVEVKNSPPYF